MKPIYIVIAASLLTLAFAPVSTVATHEETDCQLEAPPGTVVPVGDLYVNDRGSPAGTGLITGGGTWVYMEANDVAGLQLGGASAIGEEDPEAANQGICGHAPDMLIF